MHLATLIASAIVIPAYRGMAPHQPAVYAVTNVSGLRSFLSPASKSFWSFGVDCVGLETAPNNYKESNPSYSGLRLYGTEKAWAEHVLADLRKWHFNTIGGWSDDDALEKYGGKNPLPYFVVLHLGAYGKAPWNDLFSDDMEKAMDLGARTQIPKIVNDPNLAGYFTDNELGWWSDTLFLSYLSLPVDSPGRKRLIQLIRSTYRQSLTAFLSDWKPSKDVSDWEDLDHPIKLYLRPGGQGIQLVNKWAYTAADRYYRLAKKLVRKYDPHRLIVGDRYCQYYDIPVVQASVGKIDVCSTNYGAEWWNGDTSRFFLQTLHEITKKPVLIGEFYECAKENRTGSRNTGGLFPTVQTQAERAAAFSNYVRSVASRPYVIGAHWFQYYDEPKLGRGDGEDYNMGLVDVLGEPYKEITEAAANLDIPKIRAEAREPSVRTSFVIPDAPQNAKEDLTFWPHARAFLSPSSGIPFADLYVSQDRDNLYVGVLAMDYMDEGLYENGKVPEVDRPHLTLSFGSQRPTFDVRFGGKGQKPSCSVPTVSVFEKPGVKDTVILKIPRSLLGSKPLHLQAHLSSHARAEEMSWADLIRFPNYR